MINVTKSFLPPIEEYIRYLEGIWERCHLTNHGPLVLELEDKLKTYLGVKYFFYTGNGTIAIQIAIKALALSGEIITTPFSYVATSSSIIWENAKPVFVDINQADFTIDVRKIEAAITPKTSAILSTHVYGIPCDVNGIQQIADRHGLKVIYDAAHAFGVKYKGKSILQYGDISTLSFHATKLFHTVEGGGIATNHKELAGRIEYMRNFGHRGQEEFWGLGINGKNSEFHAAMGLCIYPRIDQILDSRKWLSECYDTQLNDLPIRLQRPIIPDGTEYNYAYYPVVFETETQLLAVRNALNAVDIFPRRYFFPSLNTLPFLEERQVLPNAEYISARVLCLPLYQDLTPEDISGICRIVAQSLNK